MNVSKLHSLELWKRDPIYLCFVLQNLSLVLILFFFVLNLLNQLHFFLTRSRFFDLQIEKRNIQL